MSSIMILREWQTKALEAWWPTKRGIAAVVTGAGKTPFALGCFSRLRELDPNVRLVVVVPTISLLDQWALAVEESLSLRPSDIATFGGGERSSKFGLVNIVVINTARKLLQTLPPSASWMLVVDECHRAGSRENSLALRGSYIATLGLSATPEREYDEGFVQRLVPALGPIFFKYSYSDAKADGIIADFEIENIRFALSDAEKATYEKLSVAVARAYRIYERSPSSDNSTRLRVLLQKRASVSLNARARVPTAVAAVPRGSGKTIVFHERISAAEEIASILNKRGHRATTYHSQIYEKARRERLRQFRLGIFDTLVTCRALDEGLNVPDASVAVVAASTKSTRQRIQRLGRVLRPAPGKKAARVITLYGTTAEEQSLQKEATQLIGVARIRWFSSKVTNV
jgi:superfamily II DNA or RNA helicase